MKTLMKKLPCCICLWLALSLFINSAAAETLHVAGWDNEYEACKALQLAYPNLELDAELSSYITTTQLINALISSSVDYDAFSITTNVLDAQRLFSKGYCADLSRNAAVLESVQSIYPAIVESITYNGKIYAVPFSISLSFYTYNADAWNDANLDSADVPQSFLEFLDFLEMWIERIQNEPEYDFRVCSYFDESLYNSRSYTKYLIDLLISNYVMQSKNNAQALHFDTPEFIALLKRCLEIGTALYIAEPIDRNGASLFEEGFSAQQLKHLVSLKISEDNPTQIKASLDLCVIYSGSPNAAIAGAFAEELLASMSLENAALLFMNALPVENPDYQETLNFWKEKLDKAKSVVISNTDESKQNELEDAVTQLQLTLSEVTKPENRYLISEADLKLYRELEQYFYFQPPDIFDTATEEGQNAKQLCDAFVNEKLSPEIFVQQLDQLAQMVTMEAQ